MEDTICPLDNRYSEKVNGLQEFFSYKSWIKYRLVVELEYFKMLYNLLPNVNDNILGEKITKFLTVSNTDSNIQVKKLKSLEKYL